MHTTLRIGSTFPLLGCQRFTAARLTALLICLSISATALSADGVDYLSDPAAGIALTHQQAWGDFGRDTAAARPGGKGTPLQIGETFFAKGLGHHASGEIVVDLRGQYTAFHTSVGVQWQGGHKGSVIFRIAVDGKLLSQVGPLSDSDPAKQIEVPVTGARELRLIANDAGDGFGCDMANWAEARLVRDPRVPFFGAGHVTLTNPAADANSSTSASSEAAGGFSVITGNAGPQVAIMAPARTITVSVQRGEEVRFAIPLRNVREPLQVLAEVSVIYGAPAEIELAIGVSKATRRVANHEVVALTTDLRAPSGESEIVLVTRGTDAESGVQWRALRYVRGGQTIDLPLTLPKAAETLPPPIMPSLRPALEQALVEWDWRMQDGIGTMREPRTWADAIPLLLARGDRLLQNLAANGTAVTAWTAPWESLRARYQQAVAVSTTPDSAWESLWQDVHRLRRRMAFHNPLAKVGPLLFVKQVPSTFSHQLTQYSGRWARPGGGVFVLDAPGDSMHCRQLGTLPVGSYEHPEVSWDGRRVMFAFCATRPEVNVSQTTENQFFHLFDMAADGSDLRQLTDGAYDDFSPRFLPQGKLLFLSTRRGGFHRCGRGPCPVFTLAVAEADGSRPQVVSFHETHEWDPAVLNDGRIIYTRWDYVDRHAVHYQQLWSVRPDGSDVRAFYGNNTLNPVGVWEARPVPNSNQVMATAAAHHAMTSGSIILLDVTRGTDGLEPITRLTADVLFPESEFPVGNWHAPVGVTQPLPVPTEEKRWPGHSYRTPYPLSADYFLAAYSFDPLVGEPIANRPNMFGIYLVDRFGNKELMYRDLNIGSLWPTPLRARQRPPVLPSELATAESGAGTFFLQNVYASWPQLSTADAIKRLRIVQVLPKTTPNSNSPRVGLANASPGKQVLGTVPVESDGSAYFQAPAGIALAFQALDERGMAVQTMRSLTYLQPGEHASCIGCHEHRTTAPGARATALAAQRPPSTIEPGPDGAKPFSYAILVQPILDQHCVRCHCPADARGKVDLTGSPAGEFTVSYQALAPRVPYSEWKGTPQANSEPLSPVDRFGARASKLMALLLKGHEDVKLSAEELQRMATWMDTNALFYGTFDPADQKRQQRGERIAGPTLE